MYACFPLFSKFHGKILNVGWWLKNSLVAFIDRVWICRYSKFFGDAVGPSCISYHCTMGSLDVFRVSLPLWLFFEEWWIPIRSDQIIHTFEKVLKTVYLNSWVLYLSIEHSILNFDIYWKWKISLFWLFLYFIYYTFYTVSPYFYFCEKYFYWF